MTPRTKSFLRFFKLRNLLIPLSTAYWMYADENITYKYQDVYIFGFRVARFQLRA